MPIQSKKTDNTLELRVYDAIGPEWAGMVSAESVLRSIDDAGDVSDITVKINSPGGSAFDGITIHNALKSHKAKVTTIAEGLAASAASLIFMAGNERKMHENAFLVNHRASGIAMGNAKDMQGVARDLENLDKSIAKTYASVTGLDPQDVMATMDEDMLMNAEDAMNDGYATEIIDGKVPQMMFDKRLLNHLPQEIADRFGQRENTPQPPTETQDMTPEDFKNQHKDVVEGWLNEEAATAYSNAKTDLTEMIEACGGDKSAAADAFLNGKSVQEAKDERSQTLAEKLAEAEARALAAETKAKELENGADPLKVDASAEIKEEPTEDDEKKAKVQAQAAKIKGDYARNAYIESLGLNPADFKFD